MIIRYWQRARSDTGREGDSILAGIPVDTGKASDTGRDPGRYWQGRRFDTGRIPRPILAGIATLLLLSLACASPAWVSTPTPDPTGIPSPVSSPTQAPQASQKPAIADQGEPETVSATVSALRSLYVRADSNYTSEAKGVLLHGEEVSLTNKCTSNGWAEIIYKGARAWVNARYLSGDPCREEK